MDDKAPTNTSSSVIERNKVFDYVRAMLGDGMIEVELDPIHYETALDRAMNRYRQRSPNAVEESYSFLELEQDVNEYRLPDEIISVQSVFRRAIGSRTGMGAGGTLFEPFNLAYTNTYLLTGSSMGGLATYEMLGVKFYHLLLIFRVRNINLLQIQTQLLLDPIFQTNESF